MDFMLRKADFDKAADEIMARIERDGAIHRSSIVEAMVAVAATMPAFANVVPARGLSATVVDSEHVAYDKWLAEQRRADARLNLSEQVAEALEMSNGLLLASLQQAEQRRRSERDN